MRVDRSGPRSLKRPRSALLPTWSGYLTQFVTANAGEFCRQQLKTCKSLRKEKTKQKRNPINSQISKQKKTPSNNIGRLFVSQGDHRVDSSGATRRDVASRKRDKRHEHSNGGERGRVLRIHAIKQGRQKTGHS